MKIKAGFVPNSSSSSFLVAWPKRIESIEDVFTYISPEDKAKQVFEDSIHQRNIFVVNADNNELISYIIQEFYCGYIDEIWEPYFGRSETEIFDYGLFRKNFLNRHQITAKELRDNHTYENLLWEEQRIYREILAKEIALKFCRDNCNHLLYKFDYGDEDGDFFSEMEHGDTFINLPHIKINKH